MGVSYLDQRPVCVVGVLILATMFSKRLNETYSYLAPPYTESARYVDLNVTFYI